MNCKYLKKRIKNNKKEKRIYYYCTLLRKEVPMNCYKNCSNKEYKCVSIVDHKVEYKNRLKQRTCKQAKKEKNRYSIFTDDLDTCIVCGRSKQHLHEIFGGRNRSNSIKYGLVLPLCSDCHRRMHDNPGLTEEWHKKGQTKFIQVYPNLNFINIFFKNYL